MQIKKKKEELTYEYIMKKISEYDIYRYEIGDFTIGTALCNPMRNDRSPSFVIYMGQTGHLFHRDYADERYQGRCIDLVQQKYGLSYDKALKKVASDFGLDDESSEVYKSIISQYPKPLLDMKRHAHIIVSVKKWTKEYIDYWTQYGVGIEELKKEEIYPLKEFFVNRRKEYMEPNEIGFVYRYTEGYKIYFPDRTKEKGKWKSNITTRIVENMAALKEAKKVLITKSKKDRLVLQKYLHDTAVLNVQNESRSCFTEEFVSALRDKEVWINYDSDEPGVKACKAITEEFGYNYINIPKQYLPVKDFADLYRVHGEDALITILKSKNLI
jgi:5S rRNA maturation endonuclease (ribonuclease M5)